MSWRKVSDLEAEGVIRVEDGNHGEYRPRAEEFSTGTTSFIRAADMDGGRVHFESAEKIADSAVTRIRKGHGKPGDVLFSHKGTVGKLAIVEEDAPAFVCSPQTTFWRCLNPNVLDQRYLYCFLRSPDFSEQWESRKGETDMADYVSLTAQRELNVFVPSPEAQRGIARIVFALDDKIELNRRMNSTLEALAQKMFKSWFVDFDPVVAKSEGRQPFGLSEDLAALFPSGFEDSRLGTIPRGWMTGEIRDLCTFVETGGTPSRQEESYWADGKIPWVKTGELNDGPIFRTEEFITDLAVANSNCKVWPPGTILFAIYASPTLGRLGILQVPATANQASAALMAKASVGTGFLFQSLREAREDLQAIASGAAQQNINLRILREHPVIIPPSELCVAFERHAEVWRRRVAAGVVQSDQLAALRDLLLPKLLSGEIRVPEAERVVERMT